MKSSLKWNPKTFAPDLGAGLTVALVSIPEGMAYALVAGVSPVYGLYTGMVTTVVASLTGSTQLLVVTLTNALALVAGEQLAALQPDDPVRALFTLTLLVGVCMTVLGALRMGSVIRFVSREVMSGFIFATALLIVLGQYKDLVGYASSLDANKLIRAIDITRNYASWNSQASLVGVLSIAVLVVLKASPIRRFADILIIVLATIAVLLTGWERVEIVGDIAAVPSGIEALPQPMLPDLGLIPALIVGALAATVVGLAESSGVGAAYSNPDGSRSNMSRDFLGQGLGNLAGAFFQAMPAGGSLSRTGINASGGARTRWAGVYAGISLALVLVLFGAAAELIPLTGLAALLIVIGFDVMLKQGRELFVAWKTSRLNTAIAIITILAGVAADLTAAIFTGVILSLLLYAVTTAGQVKIVELHRDNEGRWWESSTPAKLKPNQTTIIEAHGNLYFASVYSLDEILPEPEEAAGATLILRFRDREIRSLTGAAWLGKYADAIKAAGGRLMLADVSKNAMDTLRATGLEARLGSVNIFPADDSVCGGTEAALAAATRPPEGP
jgi:SulP family sulfate permease